MWPFISREAKKFVEEAISSGTLKHVIRQDRCAGGLYVNTKLELKHDNYELMIGEDSFGYLTGSLYFWRFSKRERNWIWKTLINY